jgi:hypothetical protein
LAITLFHRQHVRLVCKKKGCKQLLHKENKLPTQSQLEEKLSSFRHNLIVFALNWKLYFQIQKPLPQPPTSPADNNPPASDYPLFGMPSVVADSVEIPDLSKKYIMWTKVKSAGVELSLPLDSCCSVSLCSLIHAERVQQMHPDLKMTKLTKPVAINVANERCCFTRPRDRPTRYSYYLGHWEIFSTYHVGCTQVSLAFFVW